jgi:hypothetical protein
MDVGLARHSSSIDAAELGSSSVGKIYSNSGKESLKGQPT